MEYAEDDFLMLSGIQHYAFCKRQWALIHLEQQWQENVHTVAGQLLHKKAHDKFFYEKRRDTLIVRALPVKSRELGISGECDIVEFKRCEEGISLHGHSGLYMPYPVEYKKGSPKQTDMDILQLTAQALCLEEMFSTDIPEGALFYGETRRRDTVLFSEEEKTRVRTMFAQMHDMFRRGHTPQVKWSKSCNACSLKEICLPRLGKVVPVERYIAAHMQEEDG
ncbi:MAG: CRISPR-associated protein Cas4 [Eubacteriales bacterium]|nr:CRISPR-associated protein Cas4 [Eubacteriales bacterium]